MKINLDLIIKEKVSNKYIFILFIHRVKGVIVYTNKKLNITDEPELGLKNTCERERFSEGDDTIMELQKFTWRIFKSICASFRDLKQAFNDTSCLSDHSKFLNKASKCRAYGRIRISLFKTVSGF